MAQILIRGINEKVIARLKDLAKLHGRSLESEARFILESSVSFSMDEARRVISAWRRRLAGRKFDDSCELLAEDRGR